MDSRGAAIITSDPQLADQLDRSLRDLRGWELARIDTEQWVSRSFGSGNWERPRWVFLDLRTDSAQQPSSLWEEIADLPAKLGCLKGDRPRLVGVVDDRIPLSACAAADALLSTQLRPHWNAASLPSVLDEAEAAPLRDLPQGYELSGDGVTFRTYSPQLLLPLERLQTAAARDFSILLVGETGTGKTTLARLIHHYSPRASQRLMTVACGALPVDLIDSELFGHVRGSFTGADRDKEGKFEAAGRGTLLLDEIDVLGPLQQAKLLRVLESGEYERVGSNETQKAACRTVVASNVRLESLIEEGRFRSDLFYRLDQVKVEIPPLRDRVDDIVPLAVSFVEECCREQGTVAEWIHPELLAALKGHSWPGNIRQLRNEMRRAALFAQDGVLTPDLVSPAVLAQQQSPARSTAAAASGGGLAENIAVTERDSIERMLRKQSFNRAATARALGISRVTLYNKIRKYRIDLSGESDDA